MTNAAAFILAVSLILAGISILGDVLGWWRLDGDIWGIVLVMLGTAGRWASGRVNTPDGIDAAGEPPPPTNSDKHPGKGPPAALGVLLLALCPALDGCSSPQARSDAGAWARCAGSGALMCIPSAGFDDPAQAAIAYAGCIAQKSIGCAAPFVARGNPPTATPDAIGETISLGCVQAAAGRCLGTARADNARLTRYDSLDCIEAALPRCWERKERERPPILPDAAERGPSPR